jgi:predicted RNase H-like HicB family nuclease
VKTYDVALTREGKWWMVSIPEIYGLTQARTIKEAHDMARDYIAVTLDVPAQSFEIHVHAEKIGTVEHVTQLLEDIKIARAQADALERRATEGARSLARALAAQELPLREIGAVMGVSHQRADQLIGSKREFGGGKVTGNESASKSP